MPELQVDPVAIDVGRLVRRNLASLYSSLVTRPTGEAVRRAIENLLVDERSPVSLSVIDFSQVTVIDYSCADEVIAKLLLRFLSADRPMEAFFVFRGIRELHRDPITAALERQGLAAVAEAESGGWELIGSASAVELGAWNALEKRRSVRSSEAERLLPGGGAVEALEELVLRRVVFRNPYTGGYHALSGLLPT